MVEVVWTGWPLWCRVGGDGGQENQGKHGERDVPGPRGPVPHLMPSYNHKVAKNDVPRAHPPDIARTSMQMVLIGERLLAEIGRPVRFWR
ncbi:hypothetical protein ABZ924_38175 [Streptomyces sp. NPDC046876]|uniref:hypothetical protein n=1 Tax=Streptomyces sp. NPDC046876 TaxID=3155616 RepID=UPI0033DDD267